MIYIVSLGLLSIRLFQSWGIVGHDIHLEYKAYQQFVNQGIILNDIPLIKYCLSVSILPGLLQQALGTIGTPLEPMIYKVIFVIIGAFTPVLVYSLAKLYLKTRYALLATLFFMVQINWMEAASGARFSVALAVFALSAYCFFSEYKRKYIIGFCLSMIALPFCHYGVTYVALGLYVLLFHFGGMENRPENFRSKMA